MGILIVFAVNLVTLSALLTMFGLPLEIVALIAGVDAILSIGGTASDRVGIFGWADGEINRKSRMRMN